MNDKRCEECNGRMNIGKFCGTCTMKMEKETGKVYNEITEKWHTKEEINYSFNRGLI